MLFGKIRSPRRFYYLLVTGFEKICYLSPDLYILISKPKTTLCLDLFGAVGALGCIKQKRKEVYIILPLLYNE